MPNLMNDIFTTSSTYKTLRDLKKEADTIKSTIMEDIKSTAISVSNFKRTNPIVQKITRWFSDNTDDDNDHSPLEDNEEDFDAGFKYDNGEETAQQSEEEEQASVDISEEDAKNLFNAHTRQMIACAAKQMDVSLHGLFEIKKSVDTRVSEILASTRTTESILKTISKQLDQMISYQTSVEDRLKKMQRQSILNSSGRMSLDSVMGFVKQNRTKITQSFTKTLMDFTGLTALDEKIASATTSFIHSFLYQMTKLPGLRNLFKQRDDMIGNSQSLTIRFVHRLSLSFRIIYERSPSLLLVKNIISAIEEH